MSSGIIIVELLINLPGNTSVGFGHLGPFLATLDRVINGGSCPGCLSRYAEVVTWRDQPMRKENKTYSMMTTVWLFPPSSNYFQFS